MNKEISNILKLTYDHYEMTGIHNNGSGIVTDEHYYQYDDFCTTKILYPEFQLDGEFPLDELQSIVGGNIEIVPTKYGDLVINEMGKLNGLGANFFSSWIWFQTYGETDYIAGNVGLIRNKDCDVYTILTDMLARDWHHYYRVSAAEDRQSWAYAVSDIQAT